MLSIKVSRRKNVCVCSYSLLKMQVCCRVYWLLVTFHILTVPSLPLVANRPFLLLQPHVMTWVSQTRPFSLNPAG